MTNTSSRRRAARGLVALTCLIVLCASWTTPTSAQARRRRALVTAAPATESVAATAAARDRVVRPRARRERLVRLDGSVLDAPAARDAVTDLDVTLFADRQLAVTFDRIDRRSAGSFVWHGKVAEARGGPAIFASTNGVVMGTIFAADAVYEIGPAGEGLYEVRELDPLAFPTDDPANAPVVPDVAYEAAPVAAEDTAAEIDVLVLWTQGARTAAGGTSAIQSLIDLAVANANTAYANSGIATRLRLVHKQEVTYTETTIGDDLLRLRRPSPDDTYLNEVHTLRDQYGADLVSLIGTGYTASNACGIGYLMQSVSVDFAPYAFNVVDQSCAAGNLSLAHELGHNQGMHHDVDNSGGQQGAYAYSYGYQDPAGNFRTVMAYACGYGAGCPRVPYFSTPSYQYNSVPVGTADADNAQTLNNTAITVANFRQEVSPCSYVLGATSYAAPSGGASSSVHVTVSGVGCAFGVVSSHSWLAVTSGAGGTGTGDVTFTVAANTTGLSRTATLTIAGQTFTVTQAAAITCTYTVTPLTYAAVYVGGSSTVTVTPSNSACTWAATTGSTWLGFTTSSGTGTGQVAFTFMPNPNTTPRSATFSVAGRTVTVNQAAGRAAANGTRFTFDTDIRNDFAIYRPSTSDWRIQYWNSSTTILNWGLSGDVPVPADYDGDGKLDIAVWRPATGYWYVVYSSGGWVYIPNWGVPGDIPVPADYDGDGKADYAVWRPSNGSWFISYSGGGWRYVPNWGLSIDLPVPADYDGDRKADLAVWRAATGSWLIVYSTGSWLNMPGWGLPGDTPVPADYDGDGKFDMTVWRPSTGQFLILNSSGGWRQVTGMGSTGDVAAVGDWDGDGKADPAFWRPTTGLWTALLSYSSTTMTRTWGQNGDRPLARH